MNNTHHALVIVTAIILTSIANSFAATKSKSTSKKAHTTKAITAIASSDTIPGSYKIQVITSDDDFALMRCSAQTKVTNGKRPASVSDIKRGTKLTCYGKWMIDKSRWFKVDSIEIRGAVSKSEVMCRVEAACRKIAKNGASSRQASSGYTVEPVPSASGAASHSADTSKSGQSRKSEEAKEPQLEITDVDIRGNPSKGAFCIITVSVNNLTDRTISGLAASVDFFSADDKYVCSSKYYYAVKGDLPVKPGAGCVIQIETYSDSDEWPNISGCKFDFTSRNMGNLTLSREDQALISLSR